MVGACETPNQGCACDKPGDVVDCGQVERVSGDYVSCSMGQRTCDAGKWGACIGDSISTLRIPASGRRTLGLGKGMTCPDNPCDPYCRVVIDTPDHLGLPDGGAFTEDGGLQVVPQEQTGGQGSCQSLTVKPTPQSLTVTSIGGRGIIGEYFNQVDENAAKISTAWVPTATRVDPNIDITTLFGDLGIPGLDKDNYSIRWTGSIIAPSTGTYTVCVQSDDGNRVWIDGNLISDVWYVHGAREDCKSQLNWVAGSTHSVRYEFFQISGGTRAVITWSSETIAKQTIPQSAYGLIGNNSPVVTGSARFGIEVLPDSCFPGGAPKPAWTLDRLDVATIDADGRVGLISPVAGPITVTAFLGALSATGQVNVKVDAANNDAAPAGSVTAFQGAASGVDTARILYPYDQTVYPLGLRAPVLQWDNMGVSASAVKVTLQYPSTGTPLFRWSQVIPESNPPQATIPAEVWSYFGQSAKGQTAGLSIQRLIGGSPRPELTRTITFSAAPIRGKIYYTQYHRGGGPSEMVADPSTENPARSAFSTTDNCPVCHTLSANGNVFATTSGYGYYDNNYSNPINFSPTLGGVSKVNADGTLTRISDFVGDPPRSNYTGGSNDWRGFAWAPLTPDGKYALVANNFWGNTNQTLIGIDPATRKVNTGSAMLSGGSGIGLLAQYYPSTNHTGTSWKRIEPQLNFDFGTAAPGGLIGSEFSVKRTGRIQSYFSETYKFEVVSTSTDAFQLTIDGTTVSGSGPTTLVANVPLIAGALAPFELDQINSTGASNVKVYWSSPSTPRALIPQSQLYPPLLEPAHGVNVTYANSTGGASVSRIEPDIASNWGTHNPAPGIQVDAWTSVWDTQVESPYDGAVQLCVDADEGVTLSIEGTTLIDSPTAYNGCAPAQVWAAGNKYLVHVVHTDNSGEAHLILKYKYGTTPVSEVIPSTNLYPVTPASTSNGLTATYYDLDGFNDGLPASQNGPRAFQRVDPNIDFDWLSGRANYSVISDDGAFSARWTGQLEFDCPGVYEFKTNGNVDGGRLWIDDTRVMGRWDAGPVSGAAFFNEGKHDFKFDWHSTTGNTAARLQWHSPCSGSPDFVTIPSSAFTPNPSYSRTTGYVTNGGDNGNGTSYWVWQLPTSASPTPVDATPESPGNWGLAGSTMMVPSFSP
ncbi:MAG TPA: PA14 domain-containing protein, partial [Polyangiaceae bacterium]|nr:PA14 domain-containing protein [Polyangiaceae bacterium]